MSKELRMKALRETLSLGQLITQGKVIERAGIAAKAMFCETSLLVKDEAVSYVSNHKYSKTNYNSDNKHATTVSIGKSCSNCGKSHAYNQCSAKGKICNKCKRPNHFEAVCRSKYPLEKPRAIQFKSNIHTVETTNNDTHQANFASNEASLQQNEEIEDYSFILSSTTHDTLSHVSVAINNANVRFLADSGTTLNTIDEHAYRTLTPCPQLTPSLTKLYGYKSLESIESLGCFDAILTCRSNQIASTVTVIKGYAPCLLGYRACTELGILKIINNITSSSDLKSKYSKLFENRIGQLIDYEVHLSIDKSVKPVAIKHRRIPFHMRESVSKEIQKNG